MKVLHMQSHMHAEGQMNNLIECGDIKLFRIKTAPRMIFEWRNLDSVVRKRDFFPHRIFRLCREIRNSVISTP